jgi:NADPH2:quinone reductase
MIKAIRFEKTGGSDVLQYVDYDLPPPAKGQVQVGHTAIGVNFIDTYHRTGLYPLPLPSGLGSEAAGVVAAVGEGVTGFKVGERVGYCSGAIGAYADANNVPEHRLVHLPDSISDELAAAILLKGMTAQYLIRQIHPVKAGETIVFHAAAGGVGQIGCQWAKHHLTVEGRTGQGQWLRPCGQHPRRRLGKTGARPDRRQGRAGCL